MPEETRRASMKSAVTISLVPEAKAGPFVYHGDLAAACQSAQSHGFDAVELFLPGPDTVVASQIRSALRGTSLSLAAFGTGAGFVKHKLTLTDTDPAIRQRAFEFIAAMIDLAAEFGAPAILGSMQGRHTAEVSKPEALKLLTDAVHRLGERAKSRGTFFLYEPLNRYETNLHCTLADAAALAGSNVKLLADLFHMNIEETNLEWAIRDHYEQIGHIHLADSNRRPAGLGHTDFAAIGTALKDAGYAGFISAECFPYPDSDPAAVHTMTAYLKYFA
jgi:sugar phosphate isomerase/epimerase